MNSLLTAFISSIPSTHRDARYRPRQSCRCHHLLSTLMRCLIIDCGQLVKSSSCCGGPPRLPVTRLLLRTCLYTEHGPGETSLPAHGYSLCIPVCNRAAVASAGESEVFRAGRLKERRNSAVNFHVRKMKREK